MEGNSDTRSEASSEFKDYMSSISRTRGGISPLLAPSEELNDVPNRNLNNPEKGKSKRMKSIEIAANFVASADCKPTTGDFQFAVTKFKGYLLKVDHLNSDCQDLPTYNELAKDYCENNLVVVNYPYSSYEIENEKYIDDVLFDAELYYPENSAVFYKVSDIFENSSVGSFNNALTYYKSNLRKFQRMIRFEDFFRIWKGMKRTTLIPNNVYDSKTKPLLAAIHRLALRECDEDGVDKHPITLYKAIMFQTANDCAEYAHRVTEGKEYIIFENFEIFSLSPSVEFRNALVKTQHDSRRLLLLKINIEVPYCGLVDLNKINETEKESHIFVTKTTCSVSPLQNVFVDDEYLLKPVRILDLILERNYCKEFRMVQIAKKIKEILSSEKKFYIDEN